MSRLDARWGNFNLRGRVWDHFWQDTKAGGSQNLTRTAADTLGAVSETVARGTTTFGRTSSASIASLTETATRTNAKTRTAAETLAGSGDGSAFLLLLNAPATGINESVTRTSAKTRTGADSLSSLSESAARIIAFARTTSASIATLSESVARSVLILLRSAADSLASIAEAVVGQVTSGSQHLDRTADDSLAGSSGGFLLLLSGSGEGITESVVAVTGGQHDYSASADDSIADITGTADRLGTFGRTTDDALGAISESVDAVSSAPQAYVRTVDDVIDSLDESVSIPAGGAPPTDTGSRRRRRTLWFPTQHLERGVSDAVEFLYADAAVAVTESDEWVVLDMPELVL